MNETTATLEQRMADLEAHNDEVTAHIAVIALLFGAFIAHHSETGDVKATFQQFLSVRSSAIADFGFDWRISAGETQAHLERIRRVAAQYLAVWPEGAGSDGSD